VVTLNGGRGLKGRMVNERVNFGSFVLFFGKKLQDSSRKIRMPVCQEPKKNRK
jgi:hypothetical protein